MSNEILQNTEDGNKLLGNNVIFKDVGIPGAYVFEENSIVIRLGNTMK